MSLGGTVVAAATRWRRDRRQHGLAWPGRRSCGVFQRRRKRLYAVRLSYVVVETN